MDVEYSNAEMDAMNIMVSFITGTLGMPTVSNRQAKKCAIICVNNILDVLSSLKLESEIEYFKSVRQKIEKL